MEQVEYIEQKYGPGPDPTDFDDWPTPEYASGGRVPLAVKGQRRKNIKDTELKRNHQKHRNALE